MPETYCCPSLTSSRWLIARKRGRIRGSGGEESGGWKKGRHSQRGESGKDGRKEVGIIPPLSSWSLN